MKSGIRDLSLLDVQVSQHELKLQDTGSRPTALKTKTLVGVLRGQQAVTHTLSGLDFPERTVSHAVVSLPRNLCYIVPTVQHQEERDVVFRRIHLDYSAHLGRAQLAASRVRVRVTCLFFNAKI
jgi:hypothetical protein